MATMQDIIDHVLTRLLQAKHAPKHWSRAEVLVHANATIGEFTLMTRQMQSSASVAWSTSTNVHAMPTGSVAPVALYHGGKAIRSYSLEDLDSEVVDWETAGQTGANPKIWAPLGLTQFIVYPRAGAAGKNLTVHYLAAPNYADDAAVVAIPTPYLDAIENGTYHRALFKEGPSAMANSMTELERFIDDAEQLAGRNFWRERPSWLVTPKAKSNDLTLRDPS